MSVIFCVLLLNGINNNKQNFVNPIGRHYKYISNEEMKGFVLLEIFIYLI